MAKSSKIKRKKGYEIIYLDVMIKDKFICQLTFQYCPLFKISHDEVMKFVLENKPNLPKNFEIFVSENRVI